MEALHDKFTFAGARRPAQVKLAEPSVPENKLFVGMLSRKAGEDEVREMFSMYGEIREIYMIRNADGSSKCAAFLRFVKRESACAAIDHLNNNVMMEGAARPLIVKFADNKHQRQQRQMRNIRRAEMMTVMGPAGYPAYPPAPHHPHGGGPPLSPMPIPSHHQGGPPQYPPMPQFPAEAYGPAGTAAPPPHPYMYPAPHHHHQYGPALPHQQQYHYQERQQMPPNSANSANPRPREGPAGANLFVYHLPHDLTDADLATAFNPFGSVISAKVYVDKYTGESKGFGTQSFMQG
jgi:CUG-BP- and ETR3-like factor